jgi:hypothetical protein
LEYIQWATQVERTVLHCTALHYTIRHYSVPEDMLPLRMVPRGLLFLTPTRTPGPLMQSRRSRAWGRALCVAIFPARLMRQTSQSRSMHRDT